MEFKEKALYKFKLDVAGEGINRLMLPCDTLVSINGRMNPPRLYLDTKKGKLRTYFLMASFFN